MYGYASSKSDYNIVNYISSMTRDQLLRTLSRFRCHSGSQYIICI